MKQNVYSLVVALSCLPAALAGNYPVQNIMTNQQVHKLFPDDPAVLQQRVDDGIALLRERLAEIIALKPEERTFANTMMAFDRAGLPLELASSGATALRNVSPDPVLRDKCRLLLQQISEFYVDHLSSNRELYKAVQEYAQGTRAHENLTAEEDRFLHIVLRNFEQAGLNLPDEEREQLKKIKKELSLLGMDFATNIAESNQKLAFSRAELTGLDDALIDSFDQDEDGNYILGTDYPTYFAVQRSCSVESTRERMWELFVNRAYPANNELLKKIAARRDELAQLLGFASYAHLNMSNEMAKNPETVTSFLDELEVGTRNKYAQEVAAWKSAVPEGMGLSAEGKLLPWNIGYLVAEYKKSKFDLDEEKLREYFPMEHTIEQLLDIYSQFLGIRFEHQDADGFWHEDVRYIIAYKQDGSLLGHLLLDLHPRPNKFTHACHISIAPAVKTKEGVSYPAVSVVLANFPKSTADRPALLLRSDATTFFHEFGHALHAMFGATEMTSFSGTRVARDFVELPSQMLEEWLSDYGILKKVSCHYKTGEPLSDEIISKLHAARNIASAYATRRQIGLSRLALNLYSAAAEKDLTSIKQEAVEGLTGDFIADDERDHFESSFGHLDHYASRYYCYLWSRVYAVDLFYHIKQFGLLDYGIGKRYSDEVISKGNSVDPAEQLKNFLGRDPNSDAFFEDLGL